MDTYIHVHELLGTQQVLRLQDSKTDSSLQSPGKHPALLLVSDHLMPIQSTNSNAASLSLPYPKREIEKKINPNSHLVCVTAERATTWQDPLCWYVVRAARATLLRWYKYRASESLSGYVTRCLRTRFCANQTEETAEIPTI